MESSYRFRVTASNENAYTTGDYGLNLAIGKAPSRPGTPTVLPRKAAASVSWEAPSDNGGLPVTSYTATASPGGRSCTTTSRTCLIDGLKIGSAYTFSVRATNDAGTSSGSGNSAPVTIPASAPPGPPSIAGTRRAGDGAAAVAVEPSALPGSVTTSIKITSSPAGRTCAVTLPARECVITGLVNGSTYTFTAKATGPEGVSAPSAVSDPLQVGRRPGRPQNAVAVALAGGDARVTWDRPAYDGGLAITEYRVAGASGKGCATSTGTSCVVTGLTPGAKYTWAVSAVNPAGVSDTSTGTPPVVALPASRPDAPSVASASRAGDGKVRVVVDPGRANGSPITTVTVKAAPGVKACIITAPATECIVSGLTNGSFYTFAANASNALGTSETSAPSAPVQVGRYPGRPVNLEVVAGPGGTALVTWAPPTFDGGLPITSYTANTTVGKLSCRTSGELRCTPTGLEPGREYTVVASATNEAGTSVGSLTGPTVVGQP